MVRSYLKYIKIRSRQDSKSEVQVERKYDTYMLVDYDNLDAREFGTGPMERLEHLISIALDHFQQDHLEKTEWIYVRLYGGWYEDLHLTQLAHEVLQKIPTTHYLITSNRTDIGGKLTWRVQTQLALDLLSVPGAVFENTYRRRERLKGIRVVDPISVGFDPIKCTVKGIKHLLSHGKCPDCKTEATRILWQVEQKLVDVMMAADLLHLSNMQDAVVCVVSSDEDFWPAMLQATEQGMNPVYHIHGIPGRRIKHAYSQYANSLYREVVL